MKIDKSISEKMNLIKLTNEAFDTLSITVDVPEDDSKVTISELTSLNDDPDDGTNNDIKANTSVKVSFTDSSEKQHETTLNFRRLDLEKKIEKDNIQVNSDYGYILKVKGVNDSFKGLSKEEVNKLVNTAAIDVFSLGSDTPLTIEGTTLTAGTVSDTSVLYSKGIVNYKVITNNSLITKGSKKDIPVQVQPSNMGLLLAHDNLDDNVYYQFDGKTNIKECVATIDSSKKYTVFFPYDAESIPANYFNFDNAQGWEFSATKLPKLKRIEANNITSAQVSDSSFVFSTRSGEVNIESDDPKDHLLGNIEHLGDKAFQGIKWDVSKPGKKLCIGNKDLYFGKDAFAVTSNFSNYEVESMQAFLRIIADGYVSDGLLWSGNKENLETYSGFKSSGMASNISWFVFDNDVVLYLTANDILNNYQQFYINDESEDYKSPWSKVKSFKYAESPMYRWEENFLRGLKADKLVLDSKYELKSGTLPKANITNLVFEGSESELNIEEGAFKGSTIGTITVDTEEVKNFITSKLNSLANSPQWVITSEPASEEEAEEDEEVPTTIKADGFAHNEE